MLPLVFESENRPGTTRVIGHHVVHSPPPPFCCPGYGVLCSHRRGEGTLWVEDAPHMLALVQLPRVSGDVGKMRFSFCSWTEQISSSSFFFLFFFLLLRCRFPSCSVLFCALASTLNDLCASHSRRTELRPRKRAIRTLNSTIMPVPLIPIRVLEEYLIEYRSRCLASCLPFVSL